MAIWISQIVDFSSFDSYVYIVLDFDWWMHMRLNDQMKLSYYDDVDELDVVNWWKFLGENLGYDKTLI